MLNKVRPQIQRFIDPIARKIGVHPNILTIIGLLVSILAAYAFSQQKLILGALLILLSGFFDVIDGAVARNTNTKSKFGGLLDSTSDRFADAFIIIGIIYGGYVNWFWGTLALVACISVSYVRARAEVEGIKCDVGIAERAERLFIILGGAFIGYFTDPHFFMSLAMLLIIILGYVTVLQRIYHSWNQLKDLPEN